MPARFWIFGIGCLIAAVVIFLATREDGERGMEGKTSPLYRSTLSASLQQFKNSELVANRQAVAHVHAPQPRPSAPVSTPAAAHAAVPPPLSAATTATRGVEGAIQKGRLAFAAEKWQEALAFFDRAVSLDNRNYLTYSYRGDTLLRLGRFEEALKSYQRSYELNPSFTFALHGVAGAYLFMEKYEEALATYRQIVRLSPNDEVARSQVKALESRLAATPEVPAGRESLPPGDNPKVPDAR